MELTHLAELDCARTALAIQRYRLAMAHLPDKLSDLVPVYLDTVPKDPFDGNQLRYKKLPTGFVIYSIGQDKTDDGGKERPPKGPANWDITFIIER
jgi:hypothetical protein